MKRHFQMTLLHLSIDMLDISRTLNPDCEQVQGDMLTLRLEREFNIDSARWISVAKPA